VAEQGVGCSTSTAPNHAGLTVHKCLGATIRPRKMVRVSGVSPPVQLRAFNNDIETLERAVKERVFFVKEGGKFVRPPLPKPGHFKKQLQAAIDKLRPLLPKTAPMSRRAFVDSFEGRKKARYEAAFQSLLRDSLVEKDGHPQVFVKYEKTNYTLKSDPVPRVISARSPRYNIEVGRFLRKLEKRIFKCIDKMFGHTTVIKGKNYTDTARLLHEKWNFFVDPVAVGLDAKRFDQHVSREALEYEHMIYKWCFPKKNHSSRLAGLLKKQLRNFCSGFTKDGSVSYVVEGVRMSGDMNTSLGACLIMSSLVYCYLDFKGIKGHLANNGDDCVVVMERRDLEDFTAGLDSWFRDMGFNLEVEEPVYVFEQIKFCQTQPVYVGPLPHNFVMVRDPLHGIAKDTMCLANVSNTDMNRAWLHSVGTGGISSTGGVPIFQEFYAMYLRAGKEGKLKWDLGDSWGRIMFERGMKRYYSDVSPETRASFYYAFGITPDEQIVCERFYANATIDPRILKHPLTFQTPMPCMLP